MMKLYGYWRSTAAYRVRIALELKKIPWQAISVHLVNNGGEQHNDYYRSLNPQQLVPLLVDGDITLNQSMAILEYLDERYPEPAILPADRLLRAQVRAFSMEIAADMHPLNNLRVLQYLQKPLGLTQDAKDEWYRHWVLTGLRALESRVQSSGGLFCFEQLTMADICLVPQMYNARRFQCPLDDFPVLQSIEQHCLTLPAFQAALPENQADAG